MNETGIGCDPFGTTAEGLAVDRYRLCNASGMTAAIITFGATVTELHAPDRDGRFDDVVLGFDHLGQYETQDCYFGCVPGRVAFRIAEGRFTLDGRTYQLSLNNGRHHLHGGVRGLSRVVWKAQPVQSDEGPAVQFSYVSPDGDQGYPGNLDVTAIFTLTHGNELKIDFTATTDRPTPVNLTHHGYFNLRGAGSGDILGHVLQTGAALYSPTDEELTPTGALASVEGTPLDFRSPTTIGDRVDQVGGYDLAYLHRRQAGSLERLATVYEPTSGRAMDVLATAEALIFYTGHYLDGSLRGKNGVCYPKFAGLCLEPGHLPDAVHHDAFPSAILRPEETYRHTCVYRFAARPTARDDA